MLETKTKPLIELTPADRKLIEKFREVGNYGSLEVIVQNGHIAYIKVSNTENVSSQMLSVV